MFKYKYKCKYKYTGVLPSISIDDCVWRRCSFGALQKFGSVQLNRAFRRPWNDVLGNLTIPNWPWNGVLVVAAPSRSWNSALKRTNLARPGSAKSALEWRFGQPDSSKSALERCFGRPGRAKLSLALERHFGRPWTQQRVSQPLRQSEAPTGNFWIEITL